MAGAVDALSAHTIAAFAGCKLDIEIGDSRPLSEAPSPNPPSLDAFEPGSVLWPDSESLTRHHLETRGGCCDGGYVPVPIRIKSISGFPIRRNGLAADFAIPPASGFRTHVPTHLYWNEWNGPKKREKNERRQRAQDESGLGASVSQHTPTPAERAAEVRTSFDKAAACALGMSVELTRAVYEDRSAAFQCRDTFDERHRAFRAARVVVFDVALSTSCEHEARRLAAIAIEAYHRGLDTSDALAQARRLRNDALARLGGHRYERLTMALSGTEVALRLLTVRASVCHITPYHHTRFDDIVFGDANAPNRVRITNDKFDALMRGYADAMAEKGYEPRPRAVALGLPPPRHEKCKPRPKPGQERETPVVRPPRGKTKAPEHPVDADTPPYAELPSTLRSLFGHRNGASQLVDAETAMADALAWQLLVVAESLARQKRDAGLPGEWATLVSQFETCHLRGGNVSLKQAFAADVADAASALVVDPTFGTTPAKKIAWKPGDLHKQLPVAKKPKKTDTDRPASRDVDTIGDLCRWRVEYKISDRIEKTANRKRKRGGIETVEQETSFAIETPAATVKRLAPLATVLKEAAELLRSRRPALVKATRLASWMWFESLKRHGRHDGAADEVLCALDSHSDVSLRHGSATFVAAGKLLRHRLAALA